MMKSSITTLSANVNANDKKDFKNKKNAQKTSISNANYTDNLPMKHRVPLEIKASMYKTDGFRTKQKDAIDANFREVLKSNLNNKRMKSGKCLKVVNLDLDLLSTHFSLGSSSKNINSENRSNFDKKQSQAKQYELVRSLFKKKIEKQNFRINN